MEIIKGKSILNKVAIGQILYHRKTETIEGVERDAAAAFPIIGAGDVSGAVILLTADEASVPTQTEIKLVQVAASFLGKQMEE